MFTSQFPSSGARSQAFQRKFSFRQLPKYQLSLAKCEHQDSGAARPPSPQPTGGMATVRQNKHATTSALPYDNVARTLGYFKTSLDMAREYRFTTDYEQTTDVRRDKICKSLNTTGIHRTGTTQDGREVHCIPS